MLTYCADMIVEHFPDYENSAFVQEKFHEDWSPGRTWGWQQNRAVVGHNLKIAWNLTRIAALKNDERYAELLARLLELMPEHRYGSAARRLVRRGGAQLAARRENPSLRLARSQGLVAAGAGDPGLPDPGRHH